MDKKVYIKTALTVIFLVSVTTLLFLYTSGYRISKDGSDKTKVDLTQTGMINAKSLPEGANVYLNGELITATDDTIPGINAGIHNLKIVKSGYIEWAKDVEVYPELVTDITAVLVSRTPRLEPLTNTGAKSPSISPTLTKLAYFSEDVEEPGISIIQLNQGGVSLFGSTANTVIKDTDRIKYSRGQSIEWSPDEKTLLIQVSNNQYYLLTLNTGVVEPTATPNLVRATWNVELLKKRTDFIEKIQMPENIRKIATEEESVWSPDNKKFLYKIENGETIEYRVYNLEKPLPISEKIDNLVFSINKGEEAPKVSWYGDSFHIIMTKANMEQQATGEISLIRIDGSNKTELYNNTLYSDLAYSTPGGDKIIILTSFKSGGQTDLYTISIR